MKLQQCAYIYKQRASGPLPFDTTSVFIVIRQNELSGVRLQRFVCVSPACSQPIACVFSKFASFRLFVCGCVLRMCVREECSVQNLLSSPQRLPPEQCNTQHSLGFPRSFSTRGLSSSDTSRPWPLENARPKTNYGEGHGPAARSATFCPSLRTQICGRRAACTAGEPSRGSTMQRALCATVAKKSVT